MKRRITIVAYNRPHYLRECLDHLRRCDALDRFEIVASVDGFADWHSEEVVGLCRAITDDVRYRSRHLDCNGHVLLNLREAMDEGIDFLFCLEDDILLSREALTWCLASEAEADAETSLCLIGDRIETAEEVRRRRDDAERRGGFCPWGWYAGRAHLQALLAGWKPEWSRDGRSWDCRFTELYEERGWSRFGPVVPRCKNIGVHGRYGTPENYHCCERPVWIDDLNGPRALDSGA